MLRGATILAGLLALSVCAQQNSDTKSVVPIRVQRKVALLIGNANYQHIPQVAPALADANDMAQVFRNLHFDTVEVQTNLNADALIEAVNRFSRNQVREGDLAVIYYSGHGGQAGEENYLLPIDYDPPSEDDLVERHGGYRMSRVRDVLEARGARVRVLIFDACRNSPVVSTKAAAGGLMQMEGKPEGTFIAYASAHNQASRFQNGQRNSFYTAELLDALKNPDQDLESLFKQVQLRVYQRTDGVQRPYVYGFLSAPVYLGAVPVLSSTRPSVAPESAELAYWNSIKDSTDAADFRAYKARYPQGQFVEVADLRIGRYGERPAEPPSPIGQSAVQAGTKRVNPKDGLTYVWMPPGTFQMGCSPRDKECVKEEKPAKPVTISKGFWMGESEVTQAAYQKLTGKDPSHFKGGDRPVETVNWNEAKSYCQAVGGRLPSEAEWEYAARAGTTGARYGELDQIAWYGINSGNTTHPVKQQAPNPWGLYDMLGNVWEWAEDSNETKSQPIRGGAWGGQASYARASLRGRGVPSDRFDSFGFRCAMD